MAIVVIYNHTRNTLSQFITAKFVSPIIELDINTRSNYLIAICEDYCIYKLTINSETKKEKPIKVVDKNTQILMTIFALDEYFVGQSPQGQLYIWDLKGVRKTLVKNKTSLKQYKEVSTKIC